MAGIRIAAGARNGFCVEGGDVIRTQLENLLLHLVDEQVTEL